MNKCLDCYFVSERKNKNKIIHLCDNTLLLYDGAFMGTCDGNYNKNINNIKNRDCFKKFEEK